MNLSTRTDARPLAIEHQIEIRTYDIDGLGHVSNITYLRWMEDMRFRLFEAHFPFEQFVADGVSPVLASTYIEYKRPIKLFDRPVCRMWLSHVGNASFTVEAEIVVLEQIATRVKHVGVFTDLASGRPIRVPRVVIDKFTAAGGKRG